MPARRCRFSELEDLAQLLKYAEETERPLSLLVYSFPRAAFRTVAVEPRDWGGPGKLGADLAHGILERWDRGPTGTGASDV